MRLEKTLAAMAAEAMQKALELDEAPDPLVRPADPKHGDYQLNGAMKLAKQLGRKPRDIAEPIAEAMKALDAVADASVAGPGFVNLSLEPAWIAGQLTEQLGDPKLGVDAVENPERIVVDFSSPNIAKQMHVGHLRSTIIGQSLVNLLRFVGHEVLGDNHVGDWGTQFGLLIVGMREWGNPEALKGDAIAELERVYKLASNAANEWTCASCGLVNPGSRKECGKRDDDKALLEGCGKKKTNESKKTEAAEVFSARAREELVKLQAGDPENRAQWETFVKATRATLDKIYARLGVSFELWLGESEYDAVLAEVVADLEKRGIAKRDQGALGVFLSEIDPAVIEGALPDAIDKKLKKNKSPFIIQKRDGAFLYSTTDIATILHRKEQIGAQRSIYVVGEPQRLHFQQLFATARLMGITMGLEHISFGQVLGTDGKILRTRAGSAVTLKSLLDEAEERARTKIEEQREAGKLRIADEDLEEAIQVIGLGAVKYADLMQNRKTDYKFDWDKLIAFSGNAGPYLQSQYVRTRSIFAKGEVNWDSFQAEISLEAPDEQALARELVRFADRVHAAAATSEPHLIAGHLYAVAQAFSRFFTNCPVLRSEGATRESRLGLTKLTGLHLKTGLELLGIGVVQRM